MQLSEIYKKGLDDTPDKVAVVCSDTTCTYREFDENIKRYSAALTGIGIKKGDCVGLLMPNCLEIIYAYFACFRIGAVAVPTSLFSKVPEVIYMADHCKTKIYLTHSELEHLLVGVQDAVEALEEIYTISDDRESIFDSFNDELKKYSSDIVYPYLSVESDFPAAIFYTSGSTGKPKGVTHTHGSFVAAAVNRCHTLGHEACDSFITPSYICHAAACTIVLFPMLLAGGTAVFLCEHDTDHFIDMIFRYKVTFAAGAPNDWRKVIDSEASSGKSFDFIRYATSGGAVVPHQLQSDFKELISLPLTASLGMTECGGYMTLSPQEKPVSGSIGRPIFHTEVRLIDSSGVDVAVGEQGEIIVKSDSVMKEYWNDLVHTTDAFTDGWFHTGDIAKCDVDGNYYFCGRLKETIIVDTGNVTPGEVEDILNQHPSIEQSIIVGVNDELSGQAVFAYVQLKSGAELVSEEELTIYAAGSLADRKIPKYWSFVNKFEVAGILDKIDRKKLAEQATLLVGKV